MGNAESCVKDSYWTSNPAPDPKLKELGHYIAKDAGERAQWAYDITEKERRLERFAEQRRRAGSRLDVRMRKFLLSEARFSEGEDEEVEWQCMKALGQGGFGMVGLWQQLDESNGDVLDSVAIKQIFSDRQAHLVSCKDYKIPMEALCMYELRRTPTVCKLRDLKRFGAAHPDNRIWRLYQEYCGGGTINEMIKVYQDYNAWNAEDPKRIPEAYLWWAWHGLAMALEHMSDGTRCMQMREKPPGMKYLLHLDIKDNNILLGDKPEAGPLEGVWPTIKICDWGLGSLTSKEDPKNSKYWQSWGTSSWFPPEQYGKDEFSRRWVEEVIGKDMPFTSTHVCWQFAALILSMVSLTTGNKALVNYKRDLIAHPAKYRDNGYKLFVYEPESDLSKHYSMELLQLLEDCLQLKPVLRPSPQDLKKVTMEGCRRSFEKLVQEESKMPYVFHGSDGLGEMKSWARKVGWPMPMSL